MTTARKPDPKPGKDATDKDQQSERPEEDVVDDAVEDTFPASDPPAWSGTTGTEEPGEHNGKKPG